MIRRRDRVIRDLGLCHAPGFFWCPYCQTQWRRGGGKEGFVKSSATNHVAACREIVLFQLGWVQGPGWGTVIPVKQAEALPHWPRWRRQILATIARRKRDGLTPTNPK